MRVVSESTEFVGRDAVLLGRTEGGFYETQLAFDDATGQFIGYQGVAEDGERLDYRTLITTEVIDALPSRARTCVALGNDLDGYYAPPGCTTDD